jgi:hypothetical protein
MLLLVGPEGYWCCWWCVAQICLMHTCSTFAAAAPHEIQLKAIMNSMTTSIELQGGVWYSMDHTGKAGQQMLSLVRDAWQCAVTTLQARSVLYYCINSCCGATSSMEQVSWP